MDFLKIRVNIRIQIITKQLINERITKLLRWQTDTVNHQQGNILGIRTGITIG
jgi:hypothetical protein